MEQAAMFVRAAQFEVQPEFEPEIDALAHETCAPRPQVAALYVRERAKLEHGAKIKTFVPVLTRRKVKSLLRSKKAT
jgi:hypothetical protein